MAGTITHVAIIMGIGITYVNHKRKQIKIFIVPCYFPCSLWSDKNYHNAIEEIQKVIKQAPKGSTPIICGDFNAHIGISDNQPNKLTKFKSVGPYGNLKVNDRGIILKDYLLDQELYSAATFFRKKGHDTWCSS
mmetsp:Transcript_29094/g.35473  ORF Transcript_29094/g.35473 Transcript_29094/m.35473 type:complete len:134 (-) Transcript_29094:273-674(-)